MRVVSIAGRIFSNFPSTMRIGRRHCADSGASPLPEGPEAAHLGLRKGRIAECHRSRAQGVLDDLQPLSSTPCHCHGVSTPSWLGTQGVLALEPVKLAVANSSYSLKFYVTFHTNLLQPIFDPGPRAPLNACEQAAPTASLSPPQVPRGKTFAPFAVWPRLPAALQPRRAAPRALFRETDTRLHLDIPVLV